MDLCAGCGLAQPLARDDTVISEPRGIEPQALRDQAVDAVRRVAEAGWLRGSTVREFGSPHDGTWLPLLAARGFAQAEVADVVLDSFGVMHEPDQRAGFALRARTTAPGGVLLVQFPSLMTMVTLGQWNALRHGHFGYYSLTALAELLAMTGISLATAWEFDLYGGTILAAAVHGRAEADDRAAAILQREKDFGVTDPTVVGRLQQAAESHAAALRDWLESQGRGRPRGVRVRRGLAGARIVPHRGRRPSPAARAIADASAGKAGTPNTGTGRRDHLTRATRRGRAGPGVPTLPDLYDEVRKSYPQLEGRWSFDPGAGETGALL